MGNETRLYDFDEKIIKCIGFLEDNTGDKRKKDYNINKLSLNILRNVRTYYDFFDRSYIGNERGGNTDIIKNIKEIDDDGTVHDPESLFSSLFPVYMEFLIINKSPNDLEELIIDVKELSNELSKSTNDTIDRCALIVPSAIMSHLVGMTKSESFKKVMDFDNKVDGYNSSLNKNIEVIQGLESRIDNLKSKYNFMALSHGFERILSEKKGQLSDMRNYLIVMGMLIMVPVMIVLMFLWNSLDDLGVKVLYVTAPMLTLSFTLIYFFRIILSNYNELKPEILQMELRVTLCSFIEDYIKYSKEIKKEDKEALAMFEKVVFSEINDARNPAPAFFEGLEAMAKIISSAKK